MEFDINNLFSKAFGYQPPENFHIDDTAAEKAISGSLGSPYYANDLLGREMFLPVVLANTWYKRIFNTVCSYKHQRKKNNSKHANARARR
jgi:hypothetical protein